MASKSILGDIRKMIGGIETDDDSSPFDRELIININSVFTIVNQLGIGPRKKFHITGIDETWDDFFGDAEVVELVKSYMYLKTKLIFDPPTTGVLHEAMERQIKEFEWRLSMEDNM